MSVHLSGEHEGDIPDVEDSTEDAVEKGRWVDDLFQYRHRTGVLITCDPRGKLVRGTGTGVWSAGEVLADYMFSHREICKGVTCLELGSGVGAVGLTVAQQGAKVVVLTDVVAQLPLLERNVRENFPEGQFVHVRALDWRCPEHREGLAPWKDQWSLIIGSDIGYDPELFEPLLDTLWSQCSPSTTVYLALADREEEEEPNVADFMAAARNTFHCQVVHTRQKEPRQSVTKVLLMRRRDDMTVLSK